MRPYQIRKTDLRRNAARARHRLGRDFRWLPGYPIRLESGVVVWQLASGAGSTEATRYRLTADELGRTRRAVARIGYEFPRALPRVLDSVASWQTRVGYLLTVLQSWLHNGCRPTLRQLCDDGPLPVRLATRIKRLGSSYSAVVRLLEAVTYAMLGDKSEPGLEPICWIAQCAERLSVLCCAESPLTADQILRVQWLLFELRGELPGGTFLERLVQVFSSDVLCRFHPGNIALLPARREVGRGVGAAVPMELPQLPESDEFGACLIELLEQLASVDDRPLRIARLRLLDAYMTDHILLEMQTLGAQVAEVRTRFATRIAKELGQPRFEMARHSQQCRPVPSRLLDRRSFQHVERLLAGVARTKRLDSEVADALACFLEVLPRDCSDIRLSIASAWGLEHWRCNRTISLAYVRGLTSMLDRRGVNGRVLKYLGRVVVERRCDVLSDLTLFCDNQQQVQRAMQLLEWLWYDRQQTCHGAIYHAISAFARVTLPWCRLLDVIDRLASNDHSDYECDDVQASVLFGRDADEIAQIVLRSRRGSKRLGDWLETLRPLAEVEMVREAIVETYLEGHLPLLEELETLRGIQVKLQIETPTIWGLEQLSPWITQYPEALHEELGRLSAVCENAEAVAASLLGRQFRSASELGAQVRVLVEKLANDDALSSVVRDRMQVRLSNLNRRLRDGTELTGRQMAKTKKKLRHRVHQEVVQKYVNVYRENLKASIAERFGGLTLADTLFEWPNLKILLGVCKLRGRMREIALCTLLNRLHGTTVEFEQHPANRGFRVRMEAAGLSMDAWLDDRTMTWRGEGGQTWELRFTRSVIDFLLMGFHFDTCLAPDSFNFFSTITNAIDINKRVAYGRTPDGRIVGRCLFAINDDGCLQTYHRYTHDRSFGFATAIDEFARRLAKAMNTNLATTGRVRALVGPSWYDDGAVCMLGDVTDKNNEAHVALRNVAGSEELKIVLERYPQDELLGALDQLLAIRSLKSRPELRQTLFKVLSQSRQTSVRDRMWMATVAYQHGFTEEARHLVQGISPDQILRELRRNCCHARSLYQGIGTYADVLGMLSEISIGLAMRAVRQLGLDRNESSMATSSDDFVGAFLPSLFARAGHFHRVRSRSGDSEPAS